MVGADVEGSTFALGDIGINDPEYYYLYLGGEAEYYVSGETEVSLFGNIQ